MMKLNVLGLLATTCKLANVTNFARTKKCLRHHHFGYLNLLARAHYVGWGSLFDPGGIRFGTPVSTMTFH